MEEKKKIIYALVVIAVLLLLLNILAGLFNSDDEVVVSDNDILKNEIEITFTGVLKRFNIKGNWITKKNIHNKSLDSINYYYKVQIPTDVPIPMILKELSYRFKNQNVQVTSKEKNNYGSANIKIRSGNYVKLIAELNYTKGIVRPHSSIVFIIKNIEELSNDEIIKLLNTPIKFAVLLPLRNESIPIAEKVLASKRTYYIYLDDDANNLRFELDEDLSVNTLKKNIKSIVSSFNTPRYFFVSKKGTGFPKNFINYLKEEFKRKDRKVLNLNSYTNLIGENEKDLNSLLSFHLNKIEPGRVQVFVIDIDDWESVQSSINSYIKKGNKIGLPSRLL